MKTLLISAALMAVASAAKAENVYVMPVSASVKNGDVLERTLFQTVLFPDKRCELPLARAKDFRRAEIFSGNKTAIGCFGLTLDNVVLTIEPDGRQNSFPLTAFAKGSLKGSTISVIDPPYTHHR